MCSISRDPRCEEYTICTAVAPDAVFTVRTYGTRPLYGPGLVRKSSSREPRTRRSQRRASPEPRIVSQLRCNPNRLAQRQTKDTELAKGQIYIIQASQIGI